MTELEKIIHEHFAPALDAIVTSITQQPEGDKMVISISEYEKMKATIDQLRKDVSAANSRCATAETQRNAVLGDNNAMKARIQQMEAKAKTDNQLIDRLNIDLRAANGMAARPDPRYNKLWKDYTACKNQRDSFRTERDAKNEEIQALQRRIAELEAGVAVEVKTLCVNGQAYTAETIRKMLNVAQQRATEIDTLKRKLGENAASNVKVGNMYYDATDVKSLLNTIDQLTRNNAELRKTSATIQVKGKYLTVWNVEQIMDQLDHFKKECARVLVTLHRTEATLRGTQNNIRHERKVRKALEAELTQLRACKQYVESQGSMLSAESRAASYEDQMNQWRDKYLAENQKVLDLQEKLRAATVCVQAAGCVGSEKRQSFIDVTNSVTVLNILEPQNMRVLVKGIEVNAEDIPQMTADVVRLSKELSQTSKELAEYQRTCHELNVALSNTDGAKDKAIADLEHANNVLSDAVRQRDTTLAAQSITIRSLQDNVRSLDAKVEELLKQKKDLEGKLRARDIENKLVRGRANAVTQQQQRNVTQGVELQAGESYMTTPLGLLPINSDGMRKLCDSLNLYVSKVHSLTKFIEDWAKE